MSQSGIVVNQSGTLPPDVATSYIADVGVAVPAANILNVLGGAGITTTGVGDTLTITAVSSGLAWQAVTSASNPVSLVANNGYIAKGAGVVNFVLPAASALGDVFFIKGYGNLWTLAQNAGQSITLGTASTTIGVTGSVAALQVKDSVEILCVTANTEFEVIDATGNPQFN